MQGSGITIHMSFETIVSLLLHCCYHDCYINTNRQTINLWYLSRMAQRCDSRPTGKAVHQRQHISPHGNFMLSGVFDGWGNVSFPHLFVFIHHHHQSWINDVCLHPLWINHQWMMNPQSSILYHFPLIAMSELFLSRISGTVTYEGI